MVGMTLNPRQWPFDNPASFPEDADKDPNLFADARQRWGVKNMKRQLGYDVADTEYDMSDDERHG